MSMSNKHPISAKIAKAVRCYRQAQGLTQADVAKAFGLTQSAWNRIENGRSPLTVEHLFVLTDVLRTDMTSILELADKLQENNQ